MSGFGKPYGKSINAGKKHSAAEANWTKQLALDRAISVEEKSCTKRQDGHSEACKRMKKDMEKLRAEYARITGGKQHNPHDHDSNDEVTLRKFLGDRHGKSGSDSHFGG
ncbi:MAG: hypothetical protein ABL955_14565 [Elusimicrobiota bacterium]